MGEVAGKWGGKADVSHKIKRISVWPVLIVMSQAMKTNYTHILVRTDLFFSAYKVVVIALVIRNSHRSSVSLHTKTSAPDSIDLIVFVV